MVFVIAHYFVIDISYGCQYYCSRIVVVVVVVVSGSRLAYGTSRPCSYYDRGIKVRTRVGQNSLMFELLPIHGSFSMPTITLNILAYSNTSSILTSDNIQHNTFSDHYYIFLFPFFLNCFYRMYFYCTYPHIFKHAK